LALDAVSFFVIAGILLTAGSLPRPEPEPGGMRDRLRAGVAYVREAKTLRRLLLAQSGAFIFFAAVIPIEVIYVKETLGAGDAGYGLMLGCWGLGMLLGGLLFARLTKASIPHLLFWSTFAIGLGYLCLAIAPTLALACAASVVGGAGNGVQWVSTINAVQELTASTMQTRVMSILESANTAMPGVGFALGGAITAISGPRTTFFIASTGVFVILALAAWALGSKWPEHTGIRGSNQLDVADDIVLELIPGSAQSYSEVKP
jgi:predicted MFS family arabinose efflux permease